MTNPADVQASDDAHTKSDAGHRRRWPWLVGVLVVVIAALALWNAMVWRPVSAALKDEPDISMVAYRRWLVSPGTIVIDVRDVKGAASIADMDRNLFKAAEALKDRRFGIVVLAYHGGARWLIDADAFQTIGQERGSQNPVYVMRTMQQNVKKLDGTGAFPAVEGGWLGALGEELEQHRKFHEGWWVNTASGAGV